MFSGEMVAYRMGYDFCKVHTEAYPDVAFYVAVNDRTIYHNVTAASGAKIIWLLAHPKFSNKK